MARVQFWLHNAGLLAAMVLLIAFLRGNTGLDPLLGLASIVIGASVVLFAINVFQRIR